MLAMARDGLRVIAGDGNCVRAPSHATLVQAQAGTQRLFRGSRNFLGALHPSVRGATDKN